MNASASVFHWNGSVRVADRRDQPNLHTAKTLRIVRKALQPNPWGLTPREAQVMDALLKCESVKQVADRLGIAVKTAESHSMVARKKIGARGHFRHLLMWQEFRFNEEAGAETHRASAQMEQA